MDRKAQRKAYVVQVEKHLTQVGSIQVRALSTSDAKRIVERMMNHRSDPLQTDDPRIVWRDAVYDDFSFAMTGQVEVNESDGT